MAIVLYQAIDRYTSETAEGQVLARLHSEAVADFEPQETITKRPRSVVDIAPAGLQRRSMMQRSVTHASTAAAWKPHMTLCSRAAKVGGCGRSTTSL